MDPIDPNEPLPTTPAPQATPPRGAGWGWGGPPVPPAPPPQRDRLALGIVAFIFGGLFLVFFGFLLLAYGVVKGDAPALGAGPRVGVLEVRGAIGMGEGREVEDFLEQARRFGRDDDIKAVVVRIDSPGGSVAPSQELHDEVKRLASKKPVVCSLGNVAASGGYYVAVACPKIVAAPGTLTGSIGVISQFANVRGLAERLDVKLEIVKAGKLKDAGNPFRDMTPEERAYWQALVDRTHQQFIQAVARGRGLEADAVREVADGRVMNGEDAKGLGLVDALGNFWDAVELAKGEAKVSGEPHLVYPPEERGRLLERLMGGAAGAVADAVSSRLSRDARAAGRPGLYFLAR